MVSVEITVSTPQPAAPFSIKLPTIDDDDLLHRIYQHIRPPSCLQSSMVVLTSVVLLAIGYLVSQRLSLPFETTSFWIEGAIGEGEVGLSGFELWDLAS
uniref:Mannosyltransferase n=1 Tax=Panagrellus redivivus TaxID=6233 RepID=A0A7E4VCV5_PANRE